MCLYFYLRWALKLLTYADVEQLYLLLKCKHLLISVSLIHRQIIFSCINCPWYLPFQKASRWFVWTRLLTHFGALTTLRREGNGRQVCVNEQTSLNYCFFMLNSVLSFACATPCNIQIVTSKVTSLSFNKNNRSLVLLMFSIALVSVNMLFALLLFALFVYCIKSMLILSYQLLLLCFRIEKILILSLTSCYCYKGILLQWCWDLFGPALAFRMAVLAFNEGTAEFALLFYPGVNGKWDEICCYVFPSLLYTGIRRIVS